MNGATFFDSLPKRRPMAFVVASLIVAGAVQAGEPGCREVASSGAWRVTFLPRESTLNCKHAPSGADISGKLSFRATSGDKTELWRVVLPRDSVSNRLALLDTRNNVQGYLAICGSDNALAIRPIHRAAQHYNGELRFEARVTFGARTFACRTQPLPQSRVVQMASGPANSLLNESLFDPDADSILRFNAQSSFITRAPAGAVPPAFDVNLTALIAVPDRAAISISLVSDYYRAQYVPYYQPIDKKRCPEAPTGWMSWNAYFDTAGEKENLQEARIAAASLKPFGMRIFSIESWQDNSPALPVSKFHNLTLRPDPHKFPSGMKWLADQIRALGFIPGIWTVPFGTGDPAFYATHKQWFLHGPDGRPMQNWCGLYLLDPSQAAVRRHMEDTHRTMSRDWGYQYFKIDGMSGRNEGYSAHFYERDEVRAAFKKAVDDPFRRCIEALRRGIGPDRILLACQGHYTGPEVGLADAGRIGADIVAPHHPPGWDNYANQARTSLNQLFVNNIVWYGDPDTLLVGTANSLETVRLAASVVALTGQAMFAGDKLGELPPERMSLLQQCLPVCDIRPLDLFPIFDLLPVWDLKISRPFGAWDVVSLFNWEEKSREVCVRLEELGLDAARTYLAYDCWNRKFIGPVRGVLRAEVPGHGNVLLAVYPDLGRPQVVFSDRHLAQGGVDLKQLSWDAGQRKLSGVIGLVANHPTRLAIALPAGYSLQSARSAGDAQISTAAAPDGTLLCTLVRPESGPAEWSLQF